MSCREKRRMVLSLHLGDFSVENMFWAKMTAWFLENAVENARIIRLG
jgi:hypothetical protein